MKYSIVSKNYDVFVKNIKTYFSDKDNIILFQKRNVIKLVNYNDEKYVVKSFKVLHLINKVVSFFKTEFFTLKLFYPKAIFKSIYIPDKLILKNNEAVSSCHDFINKIKIKKLLTYEKRI